MPHYSTLYGEWHWCSMTYCYICEDVHWCSMTHCSICEDVHWCSMIYCSIYEDVHCCSMIYCSIYEDLYCCSMTHCSVRMYRCILVYDQLFYLWRLTLLFYDLLFYLWGCTLLFYDPLFYMWGCTLLFYDPLFYMWGCILLFYDPLFYLWGCILLFHDPLFYLWWCILLFYDPLFYLWGCILLFYDPLCSICEDVHCCFMTHYSVRIYTCILVYDPLSHLFAHMQHTWLYYQSTEYQIVEVMLSKTWVPVGAVSLYLHAVTLSCKSRHIWNLCQPLHTWQSVIWQLQISTSLSGIHQALAIVLETNPKGNLIRMNLLVLFYLSNLYLVTSKCACFLTIIPIRRWASSIVIVAVWMACITPAWLHELSLTTIILHTLFFST